MSYVERRTIAELCALYGLEPGIRDVFVEGASDAAVLRWYLRHRTSRAVSVIEVDAIDVPGSVVEAHSLDGGNRGRVLALANELDRQLSGSARSCPTLVHDADSDRLLGSLPAVEMLIPTDFTCLEMYLFNEATVDKFMSLVVLGCDVPASHVLGTLEGALVPLWVIKAANHMLRLSMSWVSFEACCNLIGTSIEFDEDEFVGRYLMSNGRLGERSRLSQGIRDVRSRLRDDRRHQIDGHHFLVLARWFFLKIAKNKKALVSLEVFERAFFGCLEVDMLARQPLFQQIVTRVSG